jgi:hypothetical protein
MLLLWIGVPALLAGSLAAYLVRPGSSPGFEGPAATAPKGIPEVEVVPPSRRPQRPAPPLGISIPAVQVQGPVDPIGSVGNELEIPPPGRAGWFKAGPRPGEPGRAVVVSHVDSQQGPELFFNLKSLHRGARILVEDRRGGIHRFRLMRRREVEKSRFTRDLVYGPSRRPTLVLITCGGPFTPGEGYRDNVILYARAPA